MPTIKINVNTVFFVFTLSFSSAYAEAVDPEAIINSHNKLRAEVGILEKLSYSTELAAKAQAWVDNLKRTNHCQMSHSKTNGQYGENLYWRSAVIWSDGRKELYKTNSEQVVENWGNEKIDYNYTSNSCSSNKICGHYTQIVWRTTNTVGCGMAVCVDSKEQVWACQYSPAGNWIGKKPY